MKEIWKENFKRCFKGYFKKDFKGVIKKEEGNSIYGRMVVISQENGVLAPNLWEIRGMPGHRSFPTEARDFQGIDASIRTCDIVTCLPSKRVFKHLNVFS